MEPIVCGPFSRFAREGGWRAGRFWFLRPACQTDENRRASSPAGGGAPRSSDPRFPFSFVISNEAADGTSARLYDENSSRSQRELSLAVSAILFETFEVYFANRMGPCAYCKAEGRPTREEVMPLFLSRNRPLYRTVLDHDRAIVRRGLVTSVRDGCEECNGVTLSALDNYAAQLDREYFVKIVDFNRPIGFGYEFDLLLRWLLKVTYNDDRTRSPPYRAEMFVPYILGEESHPPRRTNLLLGLISSAVTTAEQRARGLPEILAPESCGVGFLYVNKPAGPDIAFSRFVQINSYLFEIISWNPGASRPTARRHLAKICQIHLLKELRRDSEPVTIEKPSMDFVKFQTEYMIRKPLADRR